MKEQAAILVLLLGLALCEPPSPYRGRATYSRRSYIPPAPSSSYLPPSTSYGVPDYAGQAAAEHRRAAYESENNAARYQFEYAVKDEQGNDYGHRESRDGRLTRGRYSVLLPDGRRQIVEYEADELGYRPKISYEDARVL